MTTYKTTVGVDTARLLIIDPAYLHGLPEDRFLLETDPKTGFAQVVGDKGPAKGLPLGLVVSTGRGDGRYDVEVETVQHGPLTGLVARLTVTFLDDLGEDDEARLDDHEARLRRLEDWVNGTVYLNPQRTVTGPPIYDDNPFAGLPEEAVPAAAALMRDRQEAALADDDRPVAQGYNLVIGLNNTATNDLCTICGARTDPEVGPELFLAGTEALVCYDCGKKHAPDLVDLLFLSRAIGETRFIGGTEVSLEDVDRAYNLAAEGLVALQEAIIRRIEAGCKVDVAHRLFAAQPKAKAAGETLKEAFAYLYRGAGLWATWTDQSTKTATPDLDEDVPF